MLVLLFCFAVPADDFTLYIQNPWRDVALPDNQCRLTITSTYSGWSKVELTNEGNGLYSQRFTGVDPNFWKFEQDVNLILDCYTADWAYDRGMSLASIFRDAQGNLHNTAWVLVSNSEAGPRVIYSEPEVRYIQVLNPWPDASPKIIISPDNTPIKMGLNNKYCGWYNYAFVGDASNVKVKFQSVLGGDLYGADGFQGGDWIDLSDILTTNETAWVRTRMDANAKPEIRNSFPGVEGECGYRILSALVRDWPGKGAPGDYAGSIKWDFNFGKGGAGCGDDGTTGMVQETLDANGRLQRSGASCQSDHFESWFKTFPASELGGYRNDTCIELVLTKDDNGYWEYSSGNNGFFPIDDFYHPYFNSTMSGEVNYRDDGVMQDGSGRIRNFSFTMEMHTEFTYHQGEAQIFFFSGDDDVWVFINDRLVIDLGGTHSRMERTVNLDELQATLQLDDGQTYSLDMFYCERNTDNSNFAMRTNLNLSTQQAFYYESTILDSETNRTQYEFFEIKEMTSAACGVNIVDAVAVEAEVEFFLQGPEFEGATVPLASGTTHYGGIIIPSTSISIVIDTTALAGRLRLGEYLLTYRSKYDSDKQGTIPFFVGGNPYPRLEADPDSGAGYGDRLVVVLTTNSDAVIYYTIDGSTPTGDGDGETASATVTVNNPGSTVVIKALATGAGYEDNHKTFIYYQQQVPAVTADPEDTAFTTNLNVQLSVNLSGAKIYYTTNGTDPDSTSGMLYQGDPIELTQTTTVKARAFAGNYLPSAIGSWGYTRISDVLAARYVDVNADGWVDRTVMFLDIEMSNLPTSIELTSPFNSNVKRTVTSGIAWMNGNASTHTLIVDLADPFPYTGNTGFAPGQFGRILSGDGYGSGTFTVNDSVAPVIESASYRPGGLVGENTVARHLDTLVIVFSEGVGAITTTRPFEFIGSNGTTYDIKVKEPQLVGNTCRFIVDTVEGVVYPTNGDSVWIATDQSALVSDLRGNEQDVESNRRVAMVVMPPPYHPISAYLTPIDPREPAKYPLPPEILSVMTSVKSGAFGVINFQTKLTQAEINKVRASCIIYDAVGNLVASCDSFDEKNGSLELAIGTPEEETKIYWVWDGRNSRGRCAGSGTYLLIYQYTDHRGDTRNERMVLGVEG